MVLDDEFAVEVLEEPGKQVGCDEVNTQTGVADEFAENDILRADPPLVESHRHAHEFHSCPSEERDNSDIEEFLWFIRIQCEQWVWVFGKVVSAMMFPEAVIVVHNPVVPVEPKVENDAVKTSFEREPCPVHVHRCFRRLVGQHEEHHRPQRCGGNQRHGDFGNMAVGNIVSSKLIAVQEAESMSHPTYGMDMADRGDFESNSVEQPGNQCRHILAHDENIGLMNRERDEGVDDDPAMHEPCRHVWNWIRLLEYGNRHVEVRRM